MSLKFNFTVFDVRVAVLFVNGEVKVYIDLELKEGENEGDEGGEES